GESTFFVIPGEFTEAIKTISTAFSGDAPTRASTVATEREGEGGNGAPELTEAERRSLDAAPTAAERAAEEAAEMAQAAVEQARTEVAAAEHAVDRTTGG